MNFRLKPLAAVVALAATATSPAVWADGNLEGRVVDGKNMAVYSDAVVRIEELNREVLSGKAGRFRMPQLKAGTYTLTVTIGGKEIERRSITIDDNQNKIIDITLNQTTQDVEEVLVVGQAAQLQRALDRQRFADNTISVITADAIGQLPDANAAEALQRVPGLSIERDQGEGRFVRVRGISPDLNSVSVNGTQLPAPEAGRRAVALDVMPSELISALVVTKTLTPDMDANAIGGSIEVESLSALDREGSFYTMRIEGSYDELTEQSSPAFGLSGGNTLTFDNGQRLGIAGALSYDKRKFGSDNVETGGSWDGDALEAFEIRDYSIERERLGAALNFDYEVNANNHLYLRTLYSSFTDDEQRQASVIEFEDALTAGTTGSADVARELKARQETQEIVSTTFGGEHFIDDWTIEYALGYSKANEDEPGGISGAAFESSFDDMGFRNSRKPKLQAPAEYFTASNYDIDKVKYTEAYTEDEQNSLRFDITRDLFVKDYPAQVKFGGKYASREKNQNEDAWKFKDFNDETLADVAAAEPDYGLGRFGPAISADAIYELISTQDKADALDEEASQIADYRINEDISAAYLMANIEIDELLLLAGVRYEGTEHRFKGFSYDADAEVFSVFKDDNQYNHVLPSVQARYRLSDSTQLRAAWTNSVVRPTFEQMAPSFTDDGSAEAEMGNPALDAMTSANIDLGIEHFTGTAGALSAFVFRKDISDFIFETDLAGSGDFIDYEEVATYSNGDDASITGIELAASQRMEMLPAPFDGLLLSANITYSDSEANIRSYGEGAGGVASERTIDLPNQSDITGNLVIGYEKDGLMLRLATNYKSEYLLEVNDLASQDGDIYQAAQTQLDLSAAYEINPQVKVNFEIANITDEPYYTYQNKEKYNAQYEDYGPTYRLGVTFSSF